MDKLSGENSSTTPDRGDEHLDAMRSEQSLVSLPSEEVLRLIQWFKVLYPLSDMVGLGGVYPPQGGDILL